MKVLRIPAKYYDIAQWPIGATKVFAERHGCKEKVTGDYAWTNRSGSRRIVFKSANRNPRTVTVSVIGYNRRTKALIGIEHCSFEVRRA